MCKVLLTGKQLHEAVKFICPDPNDEDMNETVAVIKWCHFGEVKSEDYLLPMPAGYYIWYDDDPSLGCYPL